MNAEELRRLLPEQRTQRQVFELLSDMAWHCRECEGKTVASGQYAGGGGIQGLQRGTRTRVGLVIQSENQTCATCNKKTRHDRWTGETKISNPAASIPIKLATRILELYQFQDVIEERQRKIHELIVDHRFPMNRWGQAETPNSATMSEQEIRQKFQLLKKDESGNHNLLKSRACERCLETGQRGTPFGVRFWYAGNAVWQAGIPQSGSQAEAGCVGCGWYDFAKWRIALNTKINPSDAD